jgi:hypothetical protein
MDKIERIKELSGEVKTSRKNLRKQVRELLTKVAEEVGQETEYWNEKIGRVWIKEIEYGFGPRHNANNFAWEFVLEEDENYFKGFHDNYKAEYIGMGNLDFGDVLIIARNIESILDDLQKELDRKREEAESASNILSEAIGKYLKTE